MQPFNSILDPFFAWDRFGCGSRTYQMKRPQLHGGQSLFGAASPASSHQCRLAVTISVSNWEQTGSVNVAFVDSSAPRSLTKRSTSTKNLRQSKEPNTAGSRSRCIRCFRVRRELMQSTPQYLSCLRLRSSRGLQVLHSSAAGANMSDRG